MKKTIYILTIIIVVLFVVFLIYYFTKKEVGDTNQNVNQVIANTNTLKTNTQTNANLNTNISTNTNTAVNTNLNTNQTNQNKNINTANQNTNTQKTYQSNFSQTGNLTGDQASGFILLYDKPGQMALTANLKFDYDTIDSQCTIDGVTLSCQTAQDQGLLIAGDQVTITGYQIDSQNIAVIILDK